MGKSLRTSLVSYTSLHLRRSRTGRGFEPPDRASPRGLPRQVQSRPTVVPIPARAKSKSRPVASGILSNTTRDHPTSMPRSDRRCEEKHEPHHYQMQTLRGTPPPKAADFTQGAESLTNSALLYALIPRSA